MILFLRLGLAAMALTLGACRKNADVPAPTPAAAPTATAPSSSANQPAAPKTTPSAPPLSPEQSVRVAPVALVPGELPIIAKARAYIGSEAALSGIKSVHFVGTLVTADPADASKQTRAAMEIIFQRPEQQRIMATSDKLIEVTALDGYEGWQRVQDPADPTKWRQTLLGTAQIKRLRANTWENLSYFRGIEHVRGRVEDQGPVTIEGVACQKIAFIHAPDIVFYRYFDLATGRLVFTETEAGGTIREQGEMNVNGIRFPRSVVTSTKNAKGEAVTVTISFEKVTVNEVFPPNRFAVPGVGSR